MAKGTEFLVMRNPEILLTYKQQKSRDNTGARYFSAPNEASKAQFIDISFTKD